jgi:hypothetical protein
MMKILTLLIIVLRPHVILNTVLKEEFCLSIVRV